MIYYASGTAHIAAYLLCHGKEVPIFDPFLLIYFSHEKTACSFYDGKGLIEFVSNASSHLSQCCHLAGLY